MPLEKQATLPQWIISVSSEFKVEAEKYQISYFDVAEDRDVQLENAYRYFFE